MQHHNTEVKKRDKSQQRNVDDKQKIESLKEIISKKVKTPELAKKAAQIISEMLKNGKK